MVVKELPFIVGVLGDFSGQPTQPLKPLKDRKFIQIDRDSINDVMARLNPGLNLRVENTLTGEGEIAVQMAFKSMDDFDPARIVAQVEPLNRLLEARNKIRDLLTKVDRSEDLEGLLERILSKPDQLAQLSSELGETTSAAQGEAKP
jgi:type VI secretion system protein ImpB